MTLTINIVYKVLVNSECCQGQGMLAWQHGTFQSTKDLKYRINLLRWYFYGGKYCCDKWQNLLMQWQNYCCNNSRNIVQR